jgi:hypothetical protein
MRSFILGDEGAGYMVAEATMPLGGHFGDAGHVLILKTQRDEDVPHPFNGELVEKLRREVDGEVPTKRQELTRQAAAVE